MSKPRKIPFAFVLDELLDLQPYTKPMFGCTAIYIGEKIVFILRDRESNPEDNGVWIAAISEHHDELKKILPSMRSLQLFGPGPTGWQVIPSDSPSFEEEALRACELAAKNDPRIGKIPKRKKPLSATERKKKKTARK